MQESDVKPNLPTSGQVLGVLVKKLGIHDSILRSRTAQRYFSGNISAIVKDSSRKEIIESIASVFIRVGLIPDRQEAIGREQTFESIAAVIESHASAWDTVRSFLRPRVFPVGRENLSVIWSAYVRLAVIDLSLRCAAYLRLTSSSFPATDTFDCLHPTKRGRYLNRKRSDSGLTLQDLADEVGVSENTIDAWMYQNVRPSDDHLIQIAAAFARCSDEYDCDALMAELRRFYWASDIVALIDEYIGPERTVDVVQHIHKYTALACSLIDDGSAGVVEASHLIDLLHYGVHVDLARRILSELMNRESDDEWKEDLKWAGVSWEYRVLTVNMRVHEQEVADLNQSTDGRLFEDWDISNPKAYEHYRRSFELQGQGRIPEALAEVVEAARLDPTDPVNHFTLGSVKAKIGAESGDAALVEQGLEECWIAARLDPAWLLPWTEIALILIRSGRPREALDHLQSVREDCGPLDARYYASLGAAHRECGNLQESLSSFEEAFRRDPENWVFVRAVAEAALRLGDKAKYRQYEKIARHLGAPPPSP